MRKFLPSNTSSTCDSILKCTKLSPSHCYYVSATPAVVLSRLLRLGCVAPFSTRASEDHCVHPLEPSTRHPPSLCLRASLCTSARHFVQSWTTVPFCHCPPCQFRLSLTPRCRGAVSPSAHRLRSNLPSLSPCSLCCRDAAVSPTRAVRASIAKGSAAQPCSESAAMEGW